MALECENAALAEVVDDDFFISLALLRYALHEVGLTRDHEYRIFPEEAQRLPCIF